MLRAFGLIGPSGYLMKAKKEIISYTVDVIAIVDGEEVIIDLPDAIYRDIAKYLSKWEKE